jgi:hypothetical protein
MPGPSARDCCGTGLQPCEPAGKGRLARISARIEDPQTAHRAERYRSGRNGGASKASCRVSGTGVRIPPSPPASRFARICRLGGVQALAHRSARASGTNPGVAPPTPHGVRTCRLGGASGTRPSLRSGFGHESRCRSANSSRRSDLSARGASGTRPSLRSGFGHESRCRFSFASRSCRLGGLQACPRRASAGCPGSQRDCGRTDTPRDPAAALDLSTAVGFSVEGGGPRRAARKEDAAARPVPTRRGSTSWNPT